MAIVLGAARLIFNFKLECKANDNDECLKPEKLMTKWSERDDFLYPRSAYHGEVKPENLVFNANIQEFAQKVSYIASLETAGKMTEREAYHEIKRLFKQLKRTKKELGIAEN